jgi:hypothetical protein
MTDDLALPFVIERREQLRTICRRAIAGGDVTKAELKSAVMKYAHLVCDDPVRVLKGLYTSDGELGSLVHEAVDVVTKQRDDQNVRSVATGATYPRGDRWYLDEVADPDDIDEDDDDRDDDDDAVGKTDHHASVVADLLVESGRFPTRPEALHHLLHKPGGQALLARMRKAAEQTKESDMDRIETIRAIAKTGGILAIAKAMTDENRSYGLTETEFVEIATEDAVKKYPGETPARAFTRMFTDGGADGLAIRRAHAVVKASHAEKMFGPTFPAAAKADRGEGKAYGELMSKAEEYRSAHPELSISQAFEKIYTAPANVALAKRERVESAPR